MNSKPKKSELRRPVLRRLDQLAVGVIVAVCLVAIATYWIYRGANRGRTLEFEHLEPIPVEFRMDINQAEWPELTLLPRVSETLARRIVRSRLEFGPFRDNDDLLRVSGIGPKSLERIRPYLLPLPSARAVAGESHEK